MTLGQKHRMTCSRVFQKYGKELKTQVQHKEIKFPYKTSWKISDRRWFLGKKVNLTFDRYASLITRSSMGLPCAVSDEEGPCEMHHVKHVRKEGFRYGGFTQQMALLNRKQIPLCKNFHQKVHAGLYNGPSLESLREQIRKDVDSY
jgi:hypothetical protein